ncbi:MAG: hypothetical protein FJ070_07635 [Cyanobacteria bacterium K_DeepCast_150m_m2_101]|nr:hypothetical protein [Cyanobacteria bacterium K_DeepCast_150m_m2_101]
MPPLPEPPSDRLFNNADSFAQAFDEAWTRHIRQHGAMDSAARTEQVLREVGDHPFACEQPEMAKQVAAFRIRLLGL